jgi:Ni/Co efflux regulator RcnB
MMMIVEQSVEWRSTGETEVLGENLPQRNFVHHKSHMMKSGLEPGPPQWEAGDYPPELWRGHKKNLHSS